MSRVLPILFNTDTVRAILDGRKTVTRRVVKPQLPSSCPECHVMHNEFIYDLGAQNVYCARCGEPLYNGGCPYKAPYQPNDILYVRETWTTKCSNCEYECHMPCNAPYYIYRADMDEQRDMLKWRPSIHMPKEVARIWLRVTDVRVERLQDITPKEALKEGASCWVKLNGELDDRSIMTEYISAWNSTIKKKDLTIYGWDANPWVWVIEFERCEKPEEV